MLAAKHRDKMTADKHESYPLSDISTITEVPPSYSSQGPPSYRPKWTSSTLLHRSSPDLSGPSIEEQPTTQSRERRSKRQYVRHCCTRARRCCAYEICAYTPIWFVCVFITLVIGVLLCILLPTFLIPSSVGDTGYTYWYIWPFTWTVTM